MPNCANAASSRYCARSSLSGPATCFIALRLRRRADARHRDADVHRRPDAGVEQVGLEEDLAVRDRDDVRRDVGRDVVRLRLDDRQRRQRAAAVLLVQARGALEQAASAGRRRRPGTPRGRAGGAAAATPGGRPRRAWTGRRRRSATSPALRPSMNSSPIAQPAYGARYCSGAGSEAPADDDDRVLHRAVLLERRHDLRRPSRPSGRSRRRCRRGPGPSG